jgi:hypothetical protein
MAKIGERIVSKAFEVLDANPEGVRFSELVRLIAASDRGVKYGTITGSVWDLQDQYPDRVYKPERGLFRLTKLAGFRARPRRPGLSGGPMPSCSRATACAR